MWKIIDGSTNNCSPEPSRMVPRCKWRPINYHKCLIFSGFLMPLETGLWFFALKVPPSCHIHLDASRSHCRPDLSCRAMRDYYLWFWLPPPGNLCNLLVEIISNRPDLKVPKTGTSPMKKSLPKTGTIFVGWIDSTHLLESPPPRDFHRFPTDLCFSLGPAASDCLKMLPKETIISENKFLQPKAWGRWNLVLACFWVLQALLPICPLKILG